MLALPLKGPWNDQTPVMNYMNLNISLKLMTPFPLMSNSENILSSLRLRSSAGIRCVQNPSLYMVSQMKFPMSSRLRQLDPVVSYCSMILCTSFRSYVSNSVFTQIASSFTSIASSSYALCSKNISFVFLRSRATSSSSDLTSLCCCLSFLSKLA